jgi:2-iminoacetate synthase ThiH
VTVRATPPDDEVEALAARALDGAPLSPAEAARLCAGDVLVLGGLADAARRRLRGDAVVLVRVHPFPWIAGGDAPGAPSETPDEVRLEGPVPDGATAADVRATLDRARAAAPGVPVRAVRPAEVLPLARGAGLPPRVLLSRLADSGLSTLALPSPADDPAATREGILAAHGAGIATDAPVVYGPRTTPEALAAAILPWRDLAGAADRLRAAVPVPDALPEQSPLTGTTGLEDLRAFACARLLLPGIPRVAAEAGLHGPKLAAVALSFGADTLAGALCVPSPRLSPADAERPRAFNADRARRALAETGRPVAPPPPYPARS